MGNEWRSLVDDTATPAMFSKYFDMWRDMGGVSPATSLLDWRRMCAKGRQVKYRGNLVQTREKTNFLVQAIEHYFKQQVYVNLV